MCGFFFSSRRRHTRWPRDWSSDVCSSDLGINMRHNQGDLIHMSSKHDPGPGSFLSCNQVAYAICINLITHLLQHGGEQIPDWRFVTRCTRCPDNFGKEIEIYHSGDTQLI